SFSACDCSLLFVFFFQAEDGIRDDLVTGVQTCALPICPSGRRKIAVTANQSARPPTIPASAIARIQPPHQLLLWGNASAASAQAPRSTPSARRRWRRTSLRPPSVVSVLAAPATNAATAGGAGSA